MWYDLISRDVACCCGVWCCVVPCGVTRSGVMVLRATPASTGRGRHLGRTPRIDLRRVETQLDLRRFATLWCDAQCWALYEDHPTKLERHREYQHGLVTSTTREECIVLQVCNEDNLCEFVELCRAPDSRTVALVSAWGNLSLGRGAGDKQWCVAECCVGIWCGCDCFFFRGRLENDRGLEQTWRQSIGSRGSELDGRPLF